MTIETKPHNPILQVTICDLFTLGDYRRLCRLYKIDPDKRGAFSALMRAIRNEKLGGAK